MIEYRLHWACDYIENIGADRDWREQLLDSLQQMEPEAFERLAQRLLREAVFRNVEVLGRSGDGGS